VGKRGERGNVTDERTGAAADKGRREVRAWLRERLWQKAWSHSDEDRRALLAWLRKHPGLEQGWALEFAMHDAYIAWFYSETPGQLPPLHVWLAALPPRDWGSEHMPTRLVLKRCPDWFRGAGRARS